MAVNSVICLAATVLREVSQRVGRQKLYFRCLAVLSAIILCPHGAMPRRQPAPEEREDGSAEPDGWKSLDLGVPPPANAYAVTGEYLPSFVKAVVSAWNDEFTETPLTVNNIIFVIRPDQFYQGLDSRKKDWIIHQEMFNIRDFPVVINPLTPGDNWYRSAQDQWRWGNRDAVYVLLTSIFHEITHARGGDEVCAYKEQLALFNRFENRGWLSSPYAKTCHSLLLHHYRDVKKHPEEYPQVFVGLGHAPVSLSEGKTRALDGLALSPGCHTNVSPAALTHRPVCTNVGSAIL